MSGRGPDPKELRASLVDSGWSTDQMDMVDAARIKILNRIDIG